MSKNADKRRKKKEGIKSIRWSDKFIVIISAIFSIDNEPSSLTFLLLRPANCCQSEGILGFFLIGFLLVAVLSLSAAMTIYGPSWRLVGSWLAACLCPTISRTNAIYDGFFLVRWPLLSLPLSPLSFAAKKRILGKTIKCTLYCVSIFHNHRWMGIFFLLSLWWLVNHPTFYFS